MSEEEIELYVKDFEERLRYGLTIHEESFYIEMEITI